MLKTSDSGNRRIETDIPPLWSSGQFTNYIKAPTDKLSNGRKIDIFGAITL